MGNDPFHAPRLIDKAFFAKAPRTLTRAQRRAAWQLGKCATFYRNGRFGRQIGHRKINMRQLGGVTFAGAIARMESGDGHDWLEQDIFALRLGNDILKNIYDSNMVLPSSYRNYSCGRDDCRYCADDDSDPHPVDYVDYDDYDYEALTP